MAGDWIKMRMDLASDPAVISVAEALGIEEDMVVGKLHRLWSWASSQSYDGYAHVTLMFVDRNVGIPGFAKALQDAGWLGVENGGISFPKWERHLSQSAKSRALAAMRMAKMRGKNCYAANVTKTSPEKRREEMKIRDVKQPADAGAVSSSSLHLKQDANSTYDITDSSEAPKTPESEPGTLSEAELARLYVADYNERVRPLMPNKAFVRVISGERQRKLLSRVAQWGDGIWNLVIVELRQLSGFARDGTWLDFNYLLQEKGCTKLLEGGWRKEVK